MHCFETLRASGEQAMALVERAHTLDCPQRAWLSVAEVADPRFADAHRISNPHRFPCAPLEGWGEIKRKSQHSFPGESSFAAVEQCPSTYSPSPTILCFLRRGK
jgi:hypothetical protein